MQNLVSQVIATTVLQGIADILRSTTMASDDH